MYGNYDVMPAQATKDLACYTEQISFYDIQDNIHPVRILHDKLCCIALKAAKDLHGSHQGILLWEGE